MSLARQIAMVIVAILLIGTLFGANIGVTVERTVLSADYVTQTLEDEDAYANVTDLLTDRVTEDVDSITIQNNSIPDAINVSTIDAERVVENSLTEPYVKNQTDRNIRAFYAFLHGREPLNLTVDLVPLKANFAEELSREPVSVDAVALADVGTTDREDTDNPVNGTTVEALLESESSFEQTQADFQESQPAGADMEAINQQLKDEIEPATREDLAEADEEITDAVVDLKFATVDALTGEMAYDEYVTAVADVEERIGDRTEAIIRGQLDQELPDRVSLSDELSEEDRSQIDRLTGPIGLSGLSMWLVSAFILALIGLGYLVSRSWWSVGQMTGVSTLLVGILGTLIAVLAREPVTTLLRDVGSEVESDVLLDLLVAFVEGIFLTFRNQSLLLALLGIVLLVLVYLDRRGRLDGVRDRLGAEPAPQGAGAGGGPVGKEAADSMAAQDGPSSQADDAETQPDLSPGSQGGSPAQTATDTEEPVPDDHTENDSSESDLDEPWLPGEEDDSE